MPPRANLIYLAAAFRAAALSGVTPRLHAVARVSATLPWGALLVDWVDGGPPCLPKDLLAIARALGAIHRLSRTSGWRPFLNPDDPVGYLVGVARDQLTGLWTRIPSDARTILGEEFAWAEGFVAGTHPQPPVRLAMADTHPGNFRIRSNGSAVFLDVERPVIDSPALDLAHASLPTSLVWDPSVAGAANRSDVVAFYRAWAAAVPPEVARAARPWVIAYRRLVWLRTTSWACAWAARNNLTERQNSGTAAGTGLAGKLARFIDPAMMEAARAGWRGPDAFEPEELIP